MQAALLMFFLVFFLTLLLGQVLFAGRQRILSRLQRVQDTGKKEEIEAINLPFRERIIYPALANLGRAAARFTPQQVKTGLERRLVMAGYPFRQRADRFLSLQGFFLLVLPVLTFLLNLILRLSLTRIILWTLFSLVAAFLLPQLILHLIIKRRQRTILLSLPNVLDLLVVSVEAGLGFDMALAKVTEKIKSTVAEEFKHTLNEIRLGRMRRLALRDLAARTGVPEFNAFIGSIIQADQLGVSIGNTLRVQADVMREKRRHYFEEQAMKAPIKMLFPTIFLIFPALFLIILGPAFIQIMKALGGM